MTTPAVMLIRRILMRSPIASAGAQMLASRRAEVAQRDGERLAPYRVTSSLLDAAPPGVRFAPCPPLVRGREVSADAIEHRAFVGYAFKRHLKAVQQAAMARGILG